jgi:hypothetical protein
MQERLRNYELVPRIAEAARTFSEIDLKTILQHVQEIMQGSVPITLDPKNLSELVCSDTQDVGEAFYTTTVQ